MTRGHRAFNILGAGVGHLGELALGGGLDIGKVRAAGRRDVLAADEQVGFHFRRPVYWNEMPRGIRYN
jgi:hypothetical protein